ncbi:MAG TPA: hypothetical protein VJB12_06150 [Candidatus Nanoarchaeia archaeon]|nr:hypothetical protein [Candidatus Nanoarchaeia archaeon]
MGPKQSLLLLLGVLLLVCIALFNAFTVLSLDSKMDKKIDDLKEAARPGKIQLSVISSDCPGCTDITPLIDTIRQSHINITEEKTLTQQQGASLIAKYGITRLPAIVLEGEIDKISASSFAAKEGGLLYDQVPAPYYDIQSRDVVGKVEAIRLEAAACKECPDMQQIVDTFSDQGVFFSTNAEILAESAQGKQLIAVHKIGKLPALILSDDVSAYPEILSIMAQGGFRKSGDLHVYESTLPYYNATSKQTRGLVDLTMISDSTCTQCYDVTLHRQILSQFGMTLGEEKKVDASSAEGKKLIAKHGITAVPAVVLGGDVSLYTGFDKVWQTVGTIEEDGSYVFRDNTKLGEGFPYRDLATAEVKNTIPTQ